MVHALSKLSNVIKISISRNIYTLNSLNGYWNDDWLPNSYPKTDEERKIAAKKYNLHPKEYEPYPNDGFGYGDYPKLPFEAVSIRDPQYPYDCPEYKRNFNEPLHIDIDLLGEDRLLDIGTPQRYSNGFMIYCTCLIFGSLFGLCYLSKYIPMFQPVAEKQYPWKKKTYYSFEKKN